MDGLGSFVFRMEHRKSWVKFKNAQGLIERPFYVGKSTMVGFCFIAMSDFWGGPECNGPRAWGDSPNLTLLIIHPIPPINHPYPVLNMWYHLHSPWWGVFHVDGMIFPSKWALIKIPRRSQWACRMPCKASRVARIPWAFWHSLWLSWGMKDAVLAYFTANG